MKFQLIPSFQIRPKQTKAITALFKEAFPSYPAGKIYYKTMPCLHLMCNVDKTLVGHAAIVHRNIFVGEKELQIFGISDLCVATSHQKKGVGAAMLTELESLGKKGRVDFLALITDEQGFYKKHGFQKVDGRARWILLGSNRMLGMQERQLKDSLYVKKVKQDEWPKGIIDFMGPLF